MKLRLLVVSLIFFIFPLFAYAHGLAITQQQLVGDYIVEFEYDAVGQVVSNELTSYNFELLRKMDGLQLPYERVFVKFSKQGQTAPIFSANLLPVDVLGRKSSRANITIADKGPYVAELTFYSQGQQLAKAMFNFDVAENTANNSSESAIKKYGLILVYVALVAIIITQSVWLLKRGKSEGK